MAEEAYRSLYGDLTRLKDASLLDDPAAGTGADAALFRLLLAVSEAVDRYCNRHFYALTAPRRFDGPGDATLNLPDVIAVHSLRSDDDEDGVYETEWGASDYDLLPLNAAPRAHWGGPHHAVRARGNGPQTAFRARAGALSGNGVWGYREYLEPSGSTVRSTLSDSATTLSVDDGRDFAVGQTIADAALETRSAAVPPGAHPRDAARPSERAEPRSAAAGRSRTHVKEHHLTSRVDGEAAVLVVVRPQGVHRYHVRQVQRCVARAVEAPGGCQRMLVTGIASSSLSVTRGLNGTQATRHASRVGVSLVLRGRRRWSGQRSSTRRGCGRARLHSLVAVLRRFRSRYGRPAAAGAVPAGRRLR